MEVKDLMIGDWVLDGSHIAQIVLLTCDGIIGTTFNESSNIEVVEPILLTPEILEKNGWINEHFGTQRQEWWLDKTKFPIIRYSVNDILHHNGIVLKFVHQLQHALKLCGIDKEIEL